MKAGTWEVTEEGGISQAFNLPSVAVEIIRTPICSLTRHVLPTVGDCRPPDPEFLVNNLVSSDLSSLQLP